jgi:hypothetical protein
VLLASQVTPLKSSDELVLPLISFVKSKAALTEKVTWVIYSYVLLSFAGEMVAQSLD